MQDEAVNVVRAQMLQRTGHGLRNLLSEFCRRTIRQAMILAASVSKLRLQKKIIPRNDSSTIRSSQPLSDAGLKIMAALIGSVDPAETRTESKFSKLRCAIFLPCSTVEETRKRRRLI